jgi:hypothetical protein
MLIEAIMTGKTNTAKLLLLRKWADRYRSTIWSTFIYLMLQEMRGTGRQRPVALLDKIGPIIDLRNIIQTSAILVLAYANNDIAIYVRIIKGISPEAAKRVLNVLMDPPGLPSSVASGPSHGH